MGTLSTSAWVLHDLGLAADLGGSLFGKLALNPSVESIADERERGKVVHDAWNAYNLINGISLATMAATWFLGRSAITGRSIDRTARRLVVAKDVLVSAAVLTGAANMIGGAIMERKYPGGAVPVREGEVPSPRTPPTARLLQRFFAVMGPIHIACVAGVMGLTTALAMRSGRSVKWGILSKLLP
jgi:hypothetical protein